MKIVVCLALFIAFIAVCNGFGLGRYCENECKSQIANCYSIPICAKAFSLCFPKSKKEKGDSFIIDMRLLQNCLNAFENMEGSNTIKELISCAKMCGFAEKFLGKDQYEDYSANQNENNIVA